MNEGPLAGRGPVLEPGSCSGKEHTDTDGAQSELGRGGEQRAVDLLLPDRTPLEMAQPAGSQAALVPRTSPRAGLGLGGLGAISNLGLSDFSERRLWAGRASPQSWLTKLWKTCLPCFQRKTQASRQKW